MVPAHWWPSELPTDGQWNCPLGQLVSGVTPLPRVAWVRRIESPLVKTTWGWCKGWLTERWRSSWASARRTRRGAGSMTGRWSVLRRQHRLRGSASAVSLVTGSSSMSSMLIRSAHDLLGRPAGAVIDSVPVDHRDEGFEGEPLDVAAVADCGVTERFEEVRVRLCRSTQPAERARNRLARRVERAARGIPVADRGEHEKELSMTYRNLARDARK